MRRIILAILLLSSFDLNAQSNKLLDDHILLQSIANVESNNQYWRIGRVGEKTKYQFTNITWAEYSKIPFWKINQQEYEYESERIAILHLNRIKKYLARKGYSYSIYNVGWIWNAGFGNFSRKILPSSTKYHINKLSKEYNNLLIREKELTTREFRVRIVVEN